MSKSTISTFELFQMFPDQESARLYLESRLWPDGVTCPTCRKGERITTRKGGYYRCNACQLDFTVRTGTIFERSHIPLHKWLYAMYLLVTARKGISSLQLAKEIGVTQKSAWFMLQRLREACGTKIEKLRGLVEIDETYVGGKEANKHANLKLNRGRGAVGKQAVLGMREGGGQTKARDKMRIMEFAIKNMGRCYSKQVARAFGVDLNVISGRFSELKDLGMLAETGEREEGCAVLRVVIK